jgi:hypothetical protein
MDSVLKRLFAFVFRWSENGERADGRRTARPLVVVFFLPVSLQKG